MPTFLSMAGGEVAKSEYDGHALMPFISGKKEGMPHNEMKWRFTISASIRDGDWKLIRLPDRLPVLYDLSKDISEQEDLAAEHPERVVQLLKKLGDWDVSCPQVLYLEGNIWRRNQVDLYDRDYLLDQPE
jgi:arylsulfatase A-like enzyme